MKGRNDRHEFGQHYDGCVGKAGKGGFDVCDAENHKQKTGQKRRCAERQLVHHDQNDHESGNRKRDDHLGGHVKFLLQFAQSGMAESYIDYIRCCTHPQENIHIHPLHFVTETKKL